MNDQSTPPAPGGQHPPQRSSLGGPGASATERVQLIIEAAEQAAAGIIDDAEAQAKSYFEESRQRADRVAEQRAREMWGLTDDLIARAEAVRRQSDELLRALDAARRAMDEALGAGAAGGAPGGEPPAAAPPFAPQPHESPAPVHHLREPSPALWPQEPVPPPVAPGPFPLQPEAVPPPPAPPAGDANQPSEGARLLATQMAVAGSTRAEIEGRLQHEFGIREAGPMLDAILGPQR